MDSDQDAYTMRMCKNNLRSGETVAELFQAQKADSQSGNGNQQGRRRDPLENHGTKASQKGQNAPGNEIRGNRHFVGLGKGISRAHGADIVKVDGKDDIVNKGKGGGRIQTIRLRRVLAAVVVGESNGLPRVVNVADTERDAHAGDNRLEDGVVEQANGDTKVLHALESKEGTEEGGQVVKEQLVQRS
jgi:hypothetical protein